MKEQFNSKSACNVNDTTVAKSRKFVCCYRFTPYDAMKYVTKIVKFFVFIVILDWEDYKVL